MKTFISILAMLSAMVVTSVQAEKAPDSVQRVIPAINKLASDPALIAAVEKQNAQQLTLDQIKSRDAAWRKVTGVDDFMTSLLNNDAAKAMLAFEKIQPYYFEIFLMDNQGANVAMTNKTSDYWQGDEAKWQKTFKVGPDAVHLSEVEFDDSAQAYLVQVSVPVVSNGKAIGALTVGINLDELERN